jgi:hypothetical protein
LICSTLARTSGEGRRATTVAERAGTATGLGSLDGGLASPPLPVAMASQSKGAGEDHPGKSGGLSPGSKLALAIVVVLGGLLAWSLFQGIFSLMLHIFEFLVVAIVAGWAGYKAGHHRGRRESGREGRRKRS